jgi:uncharacterized protein
VSRPPLLASERRQLLAVATESIGDVLLGRASRRPKPQDWVGAIAAPGASFVTLERDGDLLGCIGTLTSDESLVIDVARHAVAAAFADPRLPPVTADDYATMTVKISVLSEPEPIPATNHADLIEQVRPGVDGLLVECQPRRATLLPTVWEHLRDPREFLAALWHKAGLRPGTWPPRTRVARYTTEEFADAGPRSLVVPSA